MQASKLQLANRTLLNPGSPQWQRCEQVTLTLRGTEASAQPSPYIRAAWANREIGAVSRLSVSAAHNRQNLFFRLEWTDSSRNIDYDGGTVFPDAAAVLFAATSDSSPAEMGSPDQPIEAWYWRANHADLGEALRFQGLASEQTQVAPPVFNNAVWADGRWSVVIGAPVGSALSQVAFAVWEGSNQERAGLHSCSARWLELEIL